MELFLKWVKLHLRVKRFYGISENAVATQIWIVVSVYVLVAIVKEELRLDASLYRLLQNVSVTVFEEMPLQQVVTGSDDASTNLAKSSQLNLLGV